MVPETALLSTIAVTFVPEHIVCDDGVAIAFAVGFTTTVAVISSPPQPSPEVGVIIKVTVIGAAVVFVKTPLISPLPLAAIPVTVPTLFLVQV